MPRMSREKSQVTRVGCWVQGEGLFPTGGWWFPSRKAQSSVSILTPTTGWNSSTPTENHSQSILFVFTIKAGDTLQQNKSQFFPFSGEVKKIGSNDLKNHEAEGVEQLAHSPHNDPHFSNQPQVPKSSGSIIHQEDLLQAVTLAVTVYYTERIQVQSAKEETCEQSSEMDQLCHIPGINL